MGEIIRYTHRDCNFKLDFREGVGFTLFRLQWDARENMRNGEWGDHWKELMERYPEGTATLYNSLCFCKKCKKYFTEPQLTFYIPKDGFKFEYDEHWPDTVPVHVIAEHYQLLEKEQLNCPECGETSEVAVRRKIHCPVCGKEIRGRAIGCWD